MFDKIKRLGTETAIYGVSTIVGRFLTFLLTPLYANILTPSDLGVVATLYAYLAFLNVVYGYGMESAHFKYSSTLELGDRRQNFTVPFLSVLLTSAVFSACIAWQSGPVARLLDLSESHRSVIAYGAAILFLDGAAIIPFASLRMAGRATRFAALKLVNISTNVALNVLFLLVFHRGVEGIFLAGVLSSGLTLALLAPVILAHLPSRWSGELYVALLRFGLPQVPAGIAGMMIQVIDRPILQALTDRATVGIYQANYRLGIFMMLIVSMFDFAWRPFFMANASDPRARPMFARILTYFILLTSCVFLVLSFFLEDVVKLTLFFGASILPEPYWAGLAIVPVVLLAYVFLGISNNVVAGIYLEKRTRHLPAVTLLGALVNVVANYLLIPVWGIMGAAVATLLAYAVMTAALYVVAQRFYPIRYEFDRIGKIAAAGTAVFLLYCFVRLGALEILWKFALLVLFGMLMYWMKFFEPAELQRITRMAGRREQPLPRPEPPVAPGV